MSVGTREGVLPGPNGHSIAWACEQVTHEQAAELRQQARRSNYRVTTCKERPDGSALILTYTVPGELLDHFLVGSAASGPPESLDEVLWVRPFDCGVG